MIQRPSQVAEALERVTPAPVCVCQQLFGPPGWPPGTGGAKAAGVSSCWGQWDWLAGGTSGRDRQCLFAPRGDRRASSPSYGTRLHVLALRPSISPLGRG